jgi:asparagine synthase (glutamine-hydrolysing)
MLQRCDSPFGHVTCSYTVSYGNKTGPQAQNRAIFPNMCGICGMAVAVPSGGIDRQRLTAMRDLLSHRGPDGAGLWSDDSVGLGHRRLSIIDVAGGAQPLSNESGTIWVTFNGEIYNFRELTENLVALGHRFATRSDTEVLVHAYEEYGLDFVTHLNGMFAFALYDQERRRLVLARDHFGVKPLFYAHTGGTLVFGSELKAVLAGLERRPSVRRDVVQEYLIFRFPAWDRTFYAGVYRLPPGHLAIWDCSQGSLELRSYWRPPEQAVPALDLDDAADALSEHLARAVDLQMISEVPLGAFCSGGLDSGLVSAFAARASRHRLETFSVAFDDPDWDESALVEETTARFGTLHRAVTSRAAEFAQRLPALIHANDEPLSQPNSLPLYDLSGLARRHVTVALTGEGADELFGGYPRYHIARWRDSARGVPDRVLQAVAWLAHRLPDHRLRRLGDMLPLPLEEAVLYNAAFVNPGLVARLTRSPIDQAVAERRRLVKVALRPGDPLGSISRYEVGTYLEGLLERMDRMAMAHSLEGRVPFLDVTLAEWALRLPPQLKMRGRATKRVVRALASRVLGPRVSGGRKSGFGLPLAGWFRGDVLRPLLQGLLDPASALGDLVDLSLVATLVAEHLNGRADHSEVLWLLLNLSLWYDAISAGDVHSGNDGAEVRVAGMSAASS